MSSTSARTLRLLSLLQARRYWPGSELARRLEVSARTLRRDVDRIRELGYPVEAHPGVDGGYQLAPGAVLPPLVLDDEEAVALAVGLQSTARSAVAGIAEASVGALTKVVQVMPSRLRRQVEALRAMTVSATWGDSTTTTVDPGVLVTLAQHSRDCERVRFGYTTHAQHRSEREVEPLRLVPLGRRWYLVAYDLTRHDWRSFRLDRIDQPRGTGARYRPRELPANDAAEFVRSGLNSVTDRYEVEAVVHAPVEQVRHEFGQWATVTDVDGGSCLVQMVTDSLDWPAMLLGATRAEFRVRYPAELLEHLRDWSARFARAAGS